MVRMRGGRGIAPGLCGSGGPGAGGPALGVTLPQAVGPGSANGVAGRWLGHGAVNRAGRPRFQKAKMQCLFTSF